MKPQQDLPLPAVPMPGVRAPADPVAMTRVIELVADLADDHLVLGPLDRQDLQGLLCEVLERRNQYVVTPGTVTLTKRGREKLAAAEKQDATD